MRDFNTWFNESVLQSIRQASDILQGHKQQKRLVERIRTADPYQDKRFAPVIARWVIEHDTTPEEHAEDVVLFKSLHRRLKDLRVPATNGERTKKVKNLLSKKPHDFAAHYSTLQLWNQEASDVLGPDKDLSDEGLPVIMQHDGYTMYRIDTKKHCEVPLVMNSMSWCVTKGHFGNYGGPPYYPIVRDHDKEPFAIVIPGHFDKSPDEAVRNAKNDGRLSNTDLKKIRPLVQRVLPFEKYKNPYINGVHSIKGDLPKDPTPEEALRLMIDLAITPDEWPDGERAIATNAYWAYLYAKYVLKGPFPLGEPAIVTNPDYSFRYARDVLKGPLPLDVLTTRLIRQEGHLSHLASPPLQLTSNEHTITP